MEKEISRANWDAMDAAELRAWLQTAAKLWLAHDGLWFQAMEKTHGMDAAMDADREAWRRFSPIEAKRIMANLGMEPGGGLEALERALAYRLYSYLNVQACERVAPDRLIFKMVSCRVQNARRRRDLPDFPCKSVGIVEYTTFAETIDPRIRTRCISCPPELNDASCACVWEFTLGGEGE